MQIAQMLDETRELVALFRQVEPREWSVEAMVVELSGEVGSLADSVMIQEGFRRPREVGSLALDDDIADILFMLIRIADYYGIDFEEAYRKMVNVTRARLQQRISRIDQEKSSDT
jgi:NTP pyrophosphatase (non-canonical NTP hydrolase)